MSQINCLSWEQWYTEERIQREQDTIITNDVKTENISTIKKYLQEASDAKGPQNKWQVVDKMFEYIESNISFLDKYPKYAYTVYRKLIEFIYEEPNLNKDQIEKCRTYMKTIFNIELDILNKISSNSKDIFTEIKLGKGTYGTVYNNKDGTATKKMLFIDSDGDIIDAPIREICFLSSFYHPFILQGSNFRRQDNYILYDMEEMDTDLDKWMHKTSFIQRKYIIDDIVYTVTMILKDLHNLGLSHNDIKPHNILIKNNDDNKIIMKLTDWGTMVHNPLISNIDLCTPILASPEHLLHKKCGIKSDIFSLGMTIRALIYKDYDSQEDIEKAYENGDKLHIEGADPKCNSFLMNDPKDRPEPNTIVNWFEKNHNEISNIKSVFIINDGYCENKWDNCNNLSSSVREILVDWMYDVIIEDKYDLSIFVHAVWILDSCIEKSVNNTLKTTFYIMLNKKYIQLFGAACMSIAISLYAYSDINKLLKYCDNNEYTLKMLHDIVWDISCTLNHRLFINNYYNNINGIVNKRIVKYIGINSKYITMNHMQKLNVYNDLNILGNLNLDIISPNIKKSLSKNDNVKE